VQLQKSLTNSENERRVVVERLEASQQTLAELRRINQQLTDQTQRLQTELANSEVQRSGLESQLRLTSWPPESAGSKDEELMQQLQVSQRERIELQGKVEFLSDKVDTWFVQVSPLSNECCSVYQKLSASSISLNIFMYLFFLFE
jgi:rootletin